jgi:uncharacterized protein involved in exopolysaccharide biosynthesis/Mrp family chromosome partitioning ATPase
MGVILLNAFLIGVIWTTSKVPLYTTYATVVIEEPTQPVLPLSDTLEFTPPRYYQTQLDVLRSPALAAQVITNLQLSTNPTFLAVPKQRAGLNRFRAWLSHRLTALWTYSSNLLGSTPHMEIPATPQISPSSQDRSELVSLYLSLLSIKPDPYTSSVDVEFTTPDPSLSQDLANAHAQTFIRTAQTTQFTLTTEGQNLLAQQRTTQQERLAQVHARIQQLRQSYPDTPILGPENLTNQRLLDIYRRLAHARLKQIESETLRQLIEQHDPAQFPPFISNDRITQLQAMQTNLTTVQTRLITMLSPTHPRLKTLSTVQQTIQQTLMNERTALVQTLEAEREAAVSAEKLLLEEAGQQQKPAPAQGDLATALAALNAEVDSYKTLLESLRQQQQDGVIFKTITNAPITLTASAELPHAPTSPRPRHDLTYAFALGLVSAAMLGFFVEWMDTSIRTLQDVWLTTAYPTLGVIPSQASWFALLRTKIGSVLRPFTHQADQSHKDSALVTLTARELLTVNPSLIAPYHVLGNTLPLLEGRKSLRTFLLTSPGPKEGKTLTTLNLAISLAWSDFSVVVVDADLRSGHCHSLLQRERGPGLSDVLSQGVVLSASRRRAKKKTIEDTNGVPVPTVKDLVSAIIQPTAINGLSLVACGQLPINPSEGLASHMMQEVLGFLRRQYDCVLVDSPAALAADDALLLARRCDATLLVMRGHKTLMPAAHRTAEQLQVMRANVLGVILVDVNPLLAGAETAL